MAASLLLVAVGGAVRATGSGLACPTWPGCFSAGDFIPALSFHVWLEHTHRLLAGAVILLVTALVAWALVRYRHEPSVLVPAVVALAAVLAQAVLGALVVLRLLDAELVTAHLGMAMVVVAALVYLAISVRRPRQSRVMLAGRDARLARGSSVVAGLVLVQILVGGHVTGSGAGLVFVDSPAAGLVALGPVDSPAAGYNIAHRLLAVVLVAAVAWLATAALRAVPGGWLRRLPQAALALVVLQIVLGVANLWSGLSFLTVIPHLAVASWIWAVMVTQTVLAYRLAPVRHRAAEASLGARTLAESHP